MKLLVRSLISVSLAVVLAATVTRACSVCGCSLSSDWGDQGFTVTSGFEAGLRFEYFDQADLRTATGSVDRAALSFPRGDEIQQETLNRNTWLDLNYVANSAWAVSVSVPYHDRFHTTIADGDTAVSTSSASGLGDMRVVARYQLHRDAASSWGVQVGLKLPTGGFDQNFAAGPQAGELLDRGLQLGTGTTDLLAGVSWFGRPAIAVGCFVQATLDQPLAARADFLPSTSLGVSGGVRWLNSSSFTPQLQLNARFEGREHGAEADPANSGSTLVYLSPGITAEIGGRATAFAFVQLPVYQRVNGLQLEPRCVLSLGIRHAF